jgi:hypothetical protein
MIVVVGLVPVAILARMSRVAERADHDPARSWVH